MKNREEECTAIAGVIAIVLGLALVVAVPLSWAMVYFK